MFCKHKWEVLSEKTTESKFETAVHALSSGGAQEVSIPHQMCRADRKFIQLVTCVKCGKLKRFVTDI